MDEHIVKYLTLELSHGRREHVSHLLFDEMNYLVKTNNEKKKELLDKLEELREKEGVNYAIEGLGKDFRYIRK